MNKKVKIGLILIIVVAAGLLAYSFIPGFNPAGSSVGVGMPTKPSVSNTKAVKTKEVVLNEAPFNGRLTLTIPPEFEIKIFAKGLDNPRDVILDPEGTVLVSETGGGRITALPDSDNDGRADRKVAVARALNRPHGIEFKKISGRQKIFIAETGRVGMYDYDSKSMKATNKRKIADLPTEGRHFTRSLLFKPGTDTLLISVGSSCDTCIEEDWRRAAILKLNLDEMKLKPYAAGLRNAVFMAVNPKTKEVWATENGRDYLGDNTPPDEINIIKEGKDYGWPYCYGRQVLDKTFKDTDKAREHCRESVPSKIDIQAHSAILGMDFFNNNHWPEGFSNQFIAAYHGSWNRTVPTGYKVMRFYMDDAGNLRNRENFITGWLGKNGKAVGRPVDVLTTKDRTIYVTDDYAGVVYRLEYKGK